MSHLTYYKPPAFCAICNAHHTEGDSHAYCEIRRKVRSPQELPSDRPTAIVYYRRGFWIVPSCPICGGRHAHGADLEQSGRYVSAERARQWGTLGPRVPHCGDLGLPRVEYILVEGCPEELAHLQVEEVIGQTPLPWRTLDASGREVTRHRTREAAERRRLRTPLRLVQVFDARVKALRAGASTA